MAKKFLSAMAFVLSFFLVYPLTAQARTFDLAETDISLNIDDTHWYVFTRDNIENNSELEELGLSYNDMHDILYNNKAYVDAIVFYENGEYIEFTVRKTSNDSIVNLSNYDDDMVLTLAKELAEKNNVKTYTLYESQYKYINLDYPSSGMYLCEYITVVNGENYTLTFQSPKPYTDVEYNEIKGIVDSVQFDIDPSLKEKKQSTILGGIAYGAIKGVITGVVAFGISAILVKKKKKKTEQNEADNTNIQP